MTQDRGVAPPIRGGNVKLRGMSAIKVSKALEEAEERARLEEERKKAVQGLLQSLNYLMATLGNVKLEQSLSTGDNPFEWNVKVYWNDEVKKKLPDEKQRKLTDFI